MRDKLINTNLHFTRNINNFTFQNLIDKSNIIILALKR